MNYKELINKIKEKGYWKVVIRPIDFKKDLIPDVYDCKKIIESSIVSLRGWNYPHIHRDGINICGNDSIESYCDWKGGGYFEYWRFYQSGQFAHYFSMREDYRISDKKIKQIQSYHDTISTRFLSILSTLYSVTEIFEFAQRLAAKNALGKSVEVIIELGNVYGRELFFWDSYSRYLSRSYTCRFREEHIVEKRVVSKEKLIASSDKLALDVCMNIFKKFNWPEPPIKVFEEDQRKFLERRL